MLKEEGRRGSETGGKGGNVETMKKGTEEENVEAVK
jgi:hypothetical protein